MYTLARIDEEAIVALAIIFGTGLIISIVSVIAYNFRRTREAAYNAHLKDQMIQRGMTAEEIERIISARPLTPNENFFREATRGVTGFWKKQSL